MERRLWLKQQPHFPLEVCLLLGIWLLCFFVQVLLRKEQNLRVFYSILLHFFIRRKGRLVYVHFVCVQGVLLPYATKMLQFASWGMADVEQSVDQNSK